MSTPAPPPDDRTRVIPRVPAQPVGAPPLGGPPVPEPGPAAAIPVVADQGWAVVLEDRLRTVRTLAITFALVAVVALGVAVWALVRAGDDDGGGSGASPARVRALANRVERLESRSSATRTTTSSSAATGASASAVAGLQEDVESLKEQVSDAQGSASTDAVDSLSDRVDTLEGEVDELQAGGGDDTSTEGTATTP